MCIKLNDLNKEVFERALTNNLRLYKSRRRKDLWLYIACMMLGLLLISIAELIVLNNMPYETPRHIKEVPGKTR